VDPSEMAAAWLLLLSAGAGAGRTKAMAYERATTSGAQLPVIVLARPFDGEQTSSFLLYAVM